MLELPKNSILLSSLYNSMRDLATHASDDRTIILHVQGHPDITVRHTDIASPHNFIGITAENFVKIRDVLTGDINHTFPPDCLLHLCVRPGQTIRFPFSSIHSYTLTGTVSTGHMMA